MRQDKPVVIVANRGPFRWSGKRRVRAAGGLVAALDPVLRARGGVWVSAQDTDYPQVEKLQGPDPGYELKDVALSRRTRDEFYSRMSNGILWPLLHSMPATIPFGSAPWSSYVEANRAFAAATLEAEQWPAVFWIQDYHLMLVPQLIRQGGDGRSTIGWFCHVPWPSADLFATLPWRRELLDGLLGADVLGFHTEEFARHFLECVAALTPHSVDSSRKIIRVDRRKVRVEVAPIGVAWDDIQRLVNTEDVANRMWRIRNVTASRRLILGVDRLDYTKGVPERLRTIDQLLRAERSVDDLLFVQVMVPSRESVAAYRELKDEIDRLVGNINGRYATTGRMPIHYFYRNLAPADLYAHYCTASVALVTPLRDGMNLVAHEYVASRTDLSGVLVLSEFAGAARYLDGALLVNPYDIQGTAETLRFALRMSASEQRERMKTLRTKVRQLDVHRWADGVLASIERAA